MYTATRVWRCLYNRAGELSAAAKKVRVNFRLDPELASWLDGEAQAGRSKTALVEEGLRRVRGGSTGASPASPVPASGPDRAARFRQATSRRRA